MFINDLIPLALEEFAYMGKMVKNIEENIF